MWADATSSKKEKEKPLPGVKPGRSESRAAARQELRSSPGCCVQLQTCFMSGCQNQQTFVFRLKATRIIIYSATTTPSLQALRFIQAGLPQGHLQNQPLHHCPPPSWPPSTLRPPAPGQHGGTRDPSYASVPQNLLTRCLPAAPGDPRAGEQPCALVGHRTRTACCSSAAHKGCGLFYPKQCSRGTKQVAFVRCNLWTHDCLPAPRLQWLQRLGVEDGLHPQHRN